MKLCAYGICRNESKSIQSWLESVKQADAIALLDTGSKDQTLELAKDWARDSGYPALLTGCSHKPFRFDQARNAALALAEGSGADYFLSLDLDERPEADWQDKLVQALSAAGAAPRGLRVTIDNAGYSFPSLRAHGRGWHWVHSCHEVLCGPGPVADAPLTIFHRPDRDKPRLDYLPLLQTDVAERPRDGRAWHYLGREYYYRGLWLDAVPALVRSLKFDTWNEQRAGAMRFLNRCCWQLGRRAEAEYWARAAIREYRSQGACEDLAWLLQQLRDEEAGEWQAAAENAAAACSYPFG